MKINVKLGVSEETGHRTFDLKDLGVSKEEWDGFSNREKTKLVKDAVFDLPEQPYWCVDSFDTEDE